MKKISSKYHEKTYKEENLGLLYKLPCKEALKKKIQINMKEYKLGTYKSPQQALAVSYSQIQKMRPGCKKVLKKSVRKSRRSAERSPKKYISSPKHIIKKSIKRVSKRTPKRSSKKYISSPKHIIKKSIKRSPKRIPQRSIKRISQRSTKRISQRSTKRSPQRSTKRSPQRIPQSSPKRSSKFLKYKITDSLRKNIENIINNTNIVTEVQEVDGEYRIRYLSNNGMSLFEEIRNRLTSENVDVNGMSVGIYNYVKVKQL